MDQMFDRLAGVDGIAFYMVILGTTKYPLHQSWLIYSL